MDTGIAHNCIWLQTYSRKITNVSKFLKAQQIYKMVVSSYFEVCSLRT